ncbi:MAG: hypothetical protein RLZZ263_1203 [Cyanobacteriota bacterium]
MTAILQRCLARLIRLLWPRQIGNQCLLMLAAGTLFGLVAPRQTELLSPVATIFLQASQIVVMPFLIMELIVGFGKLPPGSLKTLARRGGLVLVSLWLVGALVVMTLPMFLPKLVTSEFFHAGLFERTEPSNLLKTYLPDNIFGALAADNFPAVVLFSSLLGILLQGIPEKDQLLKPLAVIRALFKRLNKLVVTLIPYGIFALIARNIAQLKPDDFIRMQGYLSISLIAFVVLTLAAWLSLMSLTPIKSADLWQIIKGPLALTASSTNLLIALPMLVNNLQELLPQALGAKGEPATQMNEELAPLISLGYSLPTLGQVASLLFIPFAAWYVDQSLQPSATFTMLLRAIPASVSGIKAVVRQELMQLGLPIDLLQLVYINGEWLYRFEKVLSLEGLVVLAVLVYAAGVGAFRPRPLRAIAGAGAIVALGSVLGFGNRVVLAAALQNRYHNDDRLMALTSTSSAMVPTEVRGPQPIKPISLAAIDQHQLLRVGVRSEGLPWAFRNRQGRLVGFDIDLLNNLARDLGVQLQIQEAPLVQLETWLRQGRLDLVAGGIQSSPQRAIRFDPSRGYLGVNLALVVPDAKVKLLQGGEASRMGRPVILAVRDADIISSGLADELGRYLSSDSQPVQVELVPTSGKEDFFSAAGQQRFDGLLTSAESGASWAVMYPRTTLITPFGKDLSSELVLLIGGKDASLRRYINGWLGREIARGGIDRLFQYWILMKGQQPLTAH